MHKHSCRKIPFLNIKSYPVIKKMEIMKYIRVEQGIMVKVTLYSKKDCHLCEIAREKLREIQKEFPFSIIEIDIEKNHEAFEKYKYLIPVIEIDGKRVFTYSINENELKNILRRKSPPQ